MPKMKEKPQAGTAKLFMNGSSQAVRLPRAFRFDGDAVRIRREGKAVILEPVLPSFRDTEEWFAELARLNKLVGEPFMADGRDQPVSPDRKIFD